MTKIESKPVRHRRVTNRQMKTPYHAPKSLMDVMSDRDPRRIPSHGLDPVVPATPKKFHDEDEE